MRQLSIKVLNLNKRVCRKMRNFFKIEGTRPRGINQFLTRSLTYRHPPTEEGRGGAGLKIDFNALV